MVVPEIDFYFQRADDINTNRGGFGRNNIKVGINEIIKHPIEFKSRARAFENRGSDLILYNRHKLENLKKKISVC